MIRLRWNPVAVVAAGAIALGVDALGGFAAHAQVPAPTSQDIANKPINLGGRGWGGGETVHKTPATGETVQFSVKGGIVSDYVYRGVTLSERKPAVGAGIEATFGMFYLGGTAASVQLPTQPSSELTVSAGIRPTIGKVDFDLGVTYFAYPGELPGGLTSGIEYYEAAARAATNIGEGLRAAGGVAYSPNVSNTGAWGWYAAGGLGYELPARLLPANLGVAITAAAGYSWFGNQLEILGGFPLPSYLNWQAGVTFTYKQLNFDLRYYDTNLSRENCFVFTGDPNASFGGQVNLLTNPDGMMSRWCSAAFVGKIFFEFEPN